MSQLAGKLLIVNADDLGRTSGITSGIFEAHRNGLVTSATLMVGYPCAKEAASKLDEAPLLGVGLHVALTGQAPILPPEKVTSLVDSSGQFPAKPEGLIDIRPEEVLAEVRAQFELFRRLTGRLPTHLDSHHHSHRLTVVCDALMILASEHRLPIRNTSPSVSESLRRVGVVSTEFFIERFFGEQARLDVLLDILGGLEDGFTEVMCHPAHVDGELRRTSSYADERQRELEVLVHPDALRAVRRMNIQLAHFGMAR